MSKEKKSLDDQIRDFYTSQRMSEDRVSEILSAGKLIAERSSRFRYIIRWLAAVAAVFIIYGLSIWHLYLFYISKNVAEELAQKHINSSPPKIVTDSFDELESKLSKLAFSLLPSEPFTEKLSLKGGQYCSVNGEFAAQITLIDTKGKLCTLFIANSKGNTLSRLNSGEYNIGDVKVKIWHNRGRLFAMAF